MENNNTAKNFLFYRSFYEAISEFNDDDRLALYDALTKFAFEDVETEFKGMKKAIFSMATPLIEASMKNYKNGCKGGRPTPKNTPPTSEPEEPEETEIILTGTAKNVEDFIADYQKHKTPDFIPNENERKKIEIVLKDLGKYDQDYWVKVFQLAKGGFLINDEIVPCSLTKILCEHNKIFRGEANLQPNTELQEKRRAEKHKKELEQKEKENALISAEVEKRKNAKDNISNILEAVDFLNTYVIKGFSIRQVAGDYRELKAIYPQIALNQEGVYYVEEKS